MAVTFGGVELTSPDEELLDLVSKHADIEEAIEFQRPSWSGLGGKKADYNQIPKVKLGRLYWPTGASRWAIGHFLASGTQLAAIRKFVKPTIVSSTAPVPLTLKIWDEDSPTSFTVETSMHLLRPKPLFQHAGEDTYWLLTLVDERYFWWQSFAQNVVAGISTWSAAIDNLATCLGRSRFITLSSYDFVYEAISADYLVPHRSLALNFEYIPPLLDAIAYSIGRKIVRKLDGTCLFQTADQAKTQRTSLLSTYRLSTLQGGSYAMGLDSEAADKLDLWAAVPDEVGFSFVNLDIDTSEDLSCVPCECTNDDFDITSLSSTLVSLSGSLTDYQGVGQIDATKFVRSTAIRWTDGGTEQNDTTLQALVDKWATDWYKWQLGDQYRLFPTVVPWQGDGYADFVEWQVYGYMATRIDRGPLNDLADRVYHQAPNLGGTCIQKIGCVPLTDVPSGTLASIIGVDANGCLVKSGVT